MNFLLKSTSRSTETLSFWPLNGLLSERLSTNWWLDRLCRQIYTNQNVLREFSSLSFRKRSFCFVDLWINNHEKFFARFEINKLMNHVFNQTEVNIGQKRRASSHDWSGTTRDSPLKSIKAWRVETEVKTRNQAKHHRYVMNVFNKYSWLIEADFTLFDSLVTSKANEFTDR